MELIVVMLCHFSHSQSSSRMQSIFVLLPAPLCYSLSCSFQLLALSLIRTYTYKLHMCSFRIICWWRFDYIKMRTISSPFPTPRSISRMLANNLFLYQHQHPDANTLNLIVGLRPIRSVSLITLEFSVKFIPSWQIAIYVFNFTLNLLLESSLFADWSFFFLLAWQVDKQFNLNRWLRFYDKIIVF